MRLHLDRAGFAVKPFTAARPFLQYLEKHLPDLLVLDLMLPDGDGLEICKELKREPRTSALPILILTARGEKPDIVLGLEFGADDYLVKPFSPSELVARLKAVLRRSTAPGPDREGLVRVGEHLVIDPGRHNALVDGRPVSLTSTEFSLLLILGRKPGWVFSREQILDSLWGDEKDVIDRTTLLDYAEIGERRFATWRMGNVNLNRVNLGIVLRFSETPVLDPFRMSGKCALALLEELMATAAVFSRDGA